MKVRKLSEGKNFKLRTISAVMIENLRFSALITQCKITEAPDAYNLSID